MRIPLFIVLCGWMLLPSCRDKEESFTVTPGRMTESVYASGKVEAKGRYTAVPLVTGTLKKAFVQAGDTVNVGDALFEIGDITARLSEQNALIALELSRQEAASGSDKLREAETQLRLAREVWQLDSGLYERQKRLWTQKVGSQLELEQRQMSFASSKANYQVAKSRLSELKRQLSASYRQAEIAHQISTERRNDYIVKSEMNGRVYDILQESGALVSPQTALAIIGSSERFIVELDVDENDITQVLAGQKVRLSLDSYGDSVFSAVVTRINPIMNERSRTFVVEAEFESAPEILYPNLTAEANIIIGERNDALLIPTEYLIDNRYVLTGKEDTTLVTIGLRDYERVEILDGISPGTVIYKPRLK